MKHQQLKIETITLFDYHKALCDADWFHSYSEDIDVRRREADNIARLKHIGRSHPVALKVWNDCQAWVAILWKNANALPPKCPNIKMQFTYSV